MGWFKKVSLILIVVLLAVLIWFQPMIFLPAFLSVLRWSVNNLLALVVAIATVSLTIITWKYVKLTHALVGLQIEPNLECGLKDQYTDAPQFVVHNAGAEAVIDVHIDHRHYVFRDLTSHPILSEGRQLNVVQRHEEHSWWDIERLGADEIRSKDVSDVVDLCSRNQKALERMILNGALQDAATGEPIKPKRVDLFSIVVFEIRFRREVNRKVYPMTKTTCLVPLANTDKFSLQDTDMWPDIPGLGLKEALDYVKSRAGRTML